VGIPPDVPIEVKTESNGHSDRQPYIAFENVSKSFGSLDVLKDISFYVNPRRDALHPRPLRRGQVGFTAEHHGLPQAGCRAHPRGR
jgi:hypothetical protein